MAQDFRTTELSPEAKDDSTSAANGQRSRRRLGDWQIPGIDFPPGALDEVDTVGTVEFQADTQNRSSVTNLGATKAFPANVEDTPILPVRPRPFSARPAPSSPGPEGTSEIGVTTNLGSGGIQSFTERLLAGSGNVLTDPLVDPSATAEGATIALPRRTSAFKQRARSSAVASAENIISGDLLTNELFGSGLSTLSVTGPMPSEIGQVTSTISGDADQIPYLGSGSTAVTAPMSIGNSGVPQSIDTAALPNSGATVTGDLERELLPETRAEIARLRARTAADSTDSDALFELSVVLHRSGLRGDARKVLTELVSVYEKRGQQQQAARIKGMLGAPKTGPISTEDLPPRPDAPTTSQLPSRTSSLSNRSNQSTSRTDSLSGRTTVLQNQTAAIGRAKEQAKKSASVYAFPPEGMIFTLPLPGQDRLPREAREILKTSEAELEQKNYLAAFDSCLEVIGLVPDYTPVFLRIAEIYTRQRQTRRARTQADALIRLTNADNNQLELWMVYRVLLHASGGDTTSLRRLVELLIDAGQTEQASIYASRLIQILDAEGMSDEALSYSVRLCELVPGDTRAALENAILRLKAGDRGGALDRWESAVAAGANSVVAKASVAALTTATNEDDHWRILSEVVPVIRHRRDETIVDAYVRTAAVMPESPTLIAGHGIILLASGDSAGREYLAQAAGARSGAAMSRATASVALGWSLAQEGRIDEYVAAVRTAIKLLKNEDVANHPAWEGLLGRIPRFVDLSLELGEVLLARGDAAGAADVLKEAHDRSRHHGPVCERLAEAYFKTGQLGSALTVLDELAVHFRSTGQLEAMAGVLRQMSQLAPNNIKVKSRLIEAYLQRGFVAEARAELIQRADLEERSGLIKDAVTSLQRAADLSWTIGLADETFTLYARIIELAPDDVGNRSGLVNYYLQMGRLAEAAEHQRAVVGIAVRNNHKHEAIAALHQVIGLTPDDTSAYYQLADMLASMGEYHQAERVYRRIVMMNPTDAIAHAKAISMASLHESQIK